MNTNNYLLRGLHTLALLSLPMLAIGQEKSITPAFIDYGDPSMSAVTYFKEIPNRMFIQKSSEASKDYITSLLNELADSQYEIDWCSINNYQDNLCRVTVKDSLIDKIIDDLLKDDAVLTARRIFVKQEMFDKYINFIEQSNVDYANYFKDPNLQNKEIWFLNEIVCVPQNYNTDLVPIDSINENLDVTLNFSGSTFIANVSKHADIFVIANKLLKTGYFISVRVKDLIPYSDVLYDNLYGTEKKSSDHFYFYNSGAKKYYYEIPNRLFIQKNSFVTQDYINELLDKLIDNSFYINWYKNDYCGVIVDNTLTDNILDQLLENDSVQLARHIYVSKSNYNQFLFYPDLENGEEWILNKITCYFSGEINHTRIDSICNALELTIENESGYSIAFQANKNADIFDVSQKLFETGLFTGAFPVITVPPTARTWSEYPSSDTTKSDTTQVSSFTIVEQDITLKIGESHQFHVNPADADVRWLQSIGPFYNNIVLFVDEKGFATALRNGTSTVAIESVADANIRSQCSVTVIDEGSIQQDKKEFTPVSEVDESEISFSLSADGLFTAEGTFWGSGAQTNYLNYIVTDQCIFLSFEINHEDSTMMFYPQPFKLEVEGCNAQEYTIYLNHRVHIVQSQDQFVKYIVTRSAPSVDATKFKNINENKINEQLFDLNGQRIITIPNKGFYIKGGSKHFINNN